MPDKSLIWPIKPRFSNIFDALLSLLLKIFPKIILAYGE